MHLAIFGSTGAVGHECLSQSLAAGHEVTVLVRDPEKLPEDLRAKIHIIAGNALVAEDVERTLSGGVEAVLFAIGVDKHSPEDLCADVTRLILDAMPRLGIGRLVWCGGGSTLVAEDQVTLGARFVRFFAATFMGLRQRDKVHQLELLESRRDVEWLGVRPLQIRKGPHRESYRLGFNTFSGTSYITFAGVGHAMVGMLSADTWMHKAPILQY